MFSHDDILLPLALTVIIDTRVREPELAEMCHQATDMLELFGCEPLSQDDIWAWFNDNRHTIQNALKSPRKNTYILRILTKFSDDMHVENLYDAMVSISIADQEYHQEESQLVQSAAALWGYERPPLKVRR